MTPTDEWSETGATLLTWKNKSLVIVHLLQSKFDKFSFKTVIIASGKEKCVLCVWKINENPGVTLPIKKNTLNQLLVDLKWGISDQQCDQKRG